MNDMRCGVQKNQLFESLEAFKAVVREASIRHHWELHVIRSNRKNVTLGCRSSPDCPFRAVCRANKNYTYVTVAHDIHTCRDNTGGGPPTVARSEASRVAFILGEIPKFFDVHAPIHPQQVVDAIKRYYGYEIHPRQAQRALNQLEIQNRRNPGQMANAAQALAVQQQQQQHPMPGQHEQQGNQATQQAQEHTIPSNDTGAHDASAWLQDPTTMLPSNIPPDTSTMTVPGTATQHPPPETPTHQQQQQQQPILHNQIPLPTPASVSTPQIGGSQGGPRLLPRSYRRRVPKVALTEFKVEFTCAACGAINHGPTSAQDDFTSKTTAAAVPQPNGAAVLPLSGSNGGIPSQAM
ncbi:hypothetical protein AJ80_02297 [Polytolypa hystricis UAMH7299]|uniref:Transposase MuDR plant domain-containing protein n=1 Tax=Polytolypa hystricis (strain UAMH7299) TaxID=1447883 RepID=A0A2B7YRK7_POLH7|nr:hypothetical protein AJ80_02297 [Polytolypa hystricis UAMH7299]